MLVSVIVLSRRRLDFAEEGVAAVRFGAVRFERGVRDGVPGRQHVLDLVYDLGDLAVARRRRIVDLDVCRERVQV